MATINIPLHEFRPNTDAPYSAAFNDLGQRFSNFFSSGDHFH